MDDTNKAESCVDNVANEVLTLAASADRDKLTNMLRHYLEVKDEYPEYVLFYQLGDFYEMFFDDAVNMSKELGLTLTARSGTPMCGVPHHSAETYIQKLIKRNYRVALCEQVVLPDGKIIRKVKKVVTPGTSVNDLALDEGKNNYIGSFCSVGGVIGMAFADVSTGELHLAHIGLSPKNAIDHIAVIELIARFAPTEVMFNTAFLDCKQAGDHMRLHTKCLAVTMEDDKFAPDLSLIENRLGNLVDGVSLIEDVSVSGALCALIRYVEYTQKTGAVRFTRLNCGSAGSQSEYLEIGMTARRNLELIASMREIDRKKGTLLWVLDRTKTPMGKRRLNALIKQPFRNHLTIVRRLDAVEELTLNTPALSELREHLSIIRDLERLTAKIVYKSANPRDIYALGASCGGVAQLKAVLSVFTADFHGEINSMLDSLDDIAALVTNAVIPAPPLAVRDGGYICDGFNAELDKFRSLAKGGDELLSEIEAREREATGIKNLKIGYNRIFGYYIEISKGQTASAPAHYTRKQTLTSGERYIIDELKQIEEEILSAKEKAIELELELLNEVRKVIELAFERVTRTAAAVGELDVICSLADVAVRENYCRPEITLENTIDMKESRHPVVEKMSTETAFTPNDCRFDEKDTRLMLITGPNMAGKSTYMRQIALIVIMAQMGGFVPAKSARIGVSDKIFTRVGASDDLVSGQSTFMVEMLEVAEILREATRHSLVVLDEIGRGTSTFDGVSIAKAVAEHVNNKIGCKTLFATHYHELVCLEKQYNGIKNYSVSVSKKGDDLTFLHKIIKGGTDRSYGIEVARYAGLPKAVIARSKKLLEQMELNSKIEFETQLLNEEESVSQIDFALIERDNAINRIKSVDLNGITPLEALSFLGELKEALE